MLISAAAIFVSLCDSNGEPDSVELARIINPIPYNKGCFPFELLVFLGAELENAKYSAFWNGSPSVNIKIQLFYWREVGDVIFHGRIESECTWIVNSSQKQARGFDDLDVNYVDVGFVLIHEMQFYRAAPGYLLEGHLERFVSTNVALVCCLIRYLAPKQDAGSDGRGRGRPAAERPNPFASALKAGFTGDEFRRVVAKQPETECGGSKNCRHGDQYANYDFPCSHVANSNMAPDCPGGGA